MTYDHLLNVSVYVCVHMCTHMCSCGACVYMWRPEVNPRYHFLDAIYLVF